MSTPEDLVVGVVSSGSNLLVSDDGFRGLVLKLAGERAGIEREGRRRRVRDAFAVELEAEVQVLGEVEWPEDGPLTGGHGS